MFPLLGSGASPRIFFPPRAQVIDPVDSNPTVAFVEGRLQQINRRCIKSINDRLGDTYQG